MYPWWGGNLKKRKREERGKRKKEEEREREGEEERDSIIMGAVGNPSSRS